MARRPGNACDDRRREAGTSICYLTDSCVANSRRRIGGCGPAISGCRTDGPLRDDGVFQTGGRREERKRARRRHRLTGLLRAGLPVGPRGFEPRTCGLRVWSERAGQSAVYLLSCAFASQCYPWFPVASCSFTGIRRGTTPCLALSFRSRSRPGENRIRLVPEGDMDRAEGDEYSLREIEFCAVESGDYADAVGRLSQMTESDVGDELITWCAPPLG
jgi:hypothetical protein